jgi:hypothetical protein
MRRFNTKQKKSEWFTPFEDDKEVKIKIQPFSLLNLTKVPSRDTFGIQELYDIFTNCVIDWKGILDSTDDKLMPCDDENKTRVFNQDFEMATLVVNRAISLKVQVVSEKEIKNSSTSQPGKETKQEA